MWTSLSFTNPINVTLSERGACQRATPIVCCTGLKNNGVAELSTVVQGTMNSGSLCLFVIVCVYVGQFGIAVATIGFQQHVGKRDLEEIAGFTAVRDKKNLVLPIEVATIGYLQHVGKRDFDNIAGFSAVRGKKNHDLSLSPEVYGDSESLQDKMYNIPIIFYNMNDRDRLARLIGMLPATEEEASNFETAEKKALPVDIKSLKTKTEEAERHTSSMGFKATHGKKSLEEYYDEY